MILLKLKDIYWSLMMLSKELIMIAKSFRECKPGVDQDCMYRYTNYDRINLWENIIDEIVVRFELNDNDQQEFLAMCGCDTMY